MSMGTSLAFSKTNPFKQSAYSKSKEAVTSQKREEKKIDIEEALGP